MKVYVVGGAIRDTILNRPVSDIDYVVVGSTPEEMEALGYKQVGADFPVFLGANGEEYALARTEKKTNGSYLGFTTSHPPHISLSQDQRRRDLTINQLAVHVDNWEEFKKTKNVKLVIDSCGGLDDLTNKMLRHTSEHFVDDPVRLLRIARFHAKYGFDITRQTMSLMQTMVTNGEVDHLVPERVWAETTKAIELTNAMEYFWILHRCGALNIIIPGLAETMVSNGKSFRSATLRNQETDVRMMILFGHMSDVSKTLTRLRAPIALMNRVLAYQRAEQLIFGNVTPETILGFLKTIKEPALLYVIAAAVTIVTPSGGLIFDSVIQSHHAIRFISFASLSQEEQETLSGKDIGIAIDQLQVKAISQLV